MLTHFVVFQDMYLKACFFWSTLRVELMSALDALQEKKPSQNQLWRLYWANHQVKYMVHCKSDISIKGREVLYVPRSQCKYVTRNLVLWIDQVVHIYS